MNVTVEGNLRGEFLLQFRRADAAMLAAKCLQQPAAEFGTEQSEAMLKFVEAGMGKFCFRSCRGVRHIYKQGLDSSPNRRPIARTLRK